MPAVFSATVFGAIGSAGNPAVVQRLAPEGVKVSASVLLLPVCLDEIASCEAGLSSQDGDDFMGALAAVERLNQRLNDADRAVVGAGIAPGFEIVRFGNVPLAKLGGLVAMRAEKHFQIDGIRFQRRSEFEFGGRVVNRVAAENQQQIDFAGAHVFDERMQRFVSVDRIGVDRFGVEDRLADVAKRSVHGMRRVRAQTGG